MIRGIVKYGHPALRQRGAEVKAVDTAVETLAGDLIQTMREAHGVGLAAQQVGVPVRLLVADISEVEDRPSWLKIGGESCDPLPLMPLVLINPEIAVGRHREPGIEGCLSFPELTGEIRRATVVQVAALLLDGRRVEFEAGDFLARVIQHEVDHVNGVLFVDRMSSAAKAGLAGRLKRLKREGEEQARQSR